MTRFLCLSNNNGLQRSPKVGFLVDHFRDVQSIVVCFQNDAKPDWFVGRFLRVYRLNRDISCLNYLNSGINV